MYKEIVAIFLGILFSGSFIYVIKRVLMKKYVKIFLVCASVFALSCSSPSEDVEELPKDEPGIAEELDAVMKRYSAVGLAVAVVDNDVIVYENTMGYKDLDAKEPWEKGDVLRIASISKSFVATSILQLVEQGKLSLDADVSDIMGFVIRNPKYPDTPITVRMLLSHTSSMSDANGYFTLDNLNRETSRTWERAWNSYTPGSRYQYCNLGYNTLGAIVEKVSGERFDKYVSEHILKPLGVYAHHNVHELDPAKLVNIYTYDASVSSYRKSDAYPSIEESLADYRMGYSTPVFSPTGGLKISVGGLARVMMMHMNMGTLDGVRILTPESCELMQSEIVPTNYEGERYGMAMLRTNDLLQGHRLVGHDGLALGAHTAMFWDKEAKYGFVIMTNGCNAKTDKVFANILCESVECLYEHFVNE